jgi:magnesium-transporting ATPase (P-type)
MSTIDRAPAAGTWLHCKGAPEEVIPLCTHVAAVNGDEALTAAMRAAVEGIVWAWANRGLRVLAAAERPIPAESAAAVGRAEAERELTLLGVVAMLDPRAPR